MSLLCDSCSYLVLVSHIYPNLFCSVEENMNFLLIVKSLSWATGSLKPLSYTAAKWEDWTLANKKKKNVGQPRITSPTTSMPLFCSIPSAFGGV